MVFLHARCTFPLKHALSCRKMPFPAEKCTFLQKNAVFGVAQGMKLQKIAGGFQGSRIKNAIQLSQDLFCGLLGWVVFFGGGGSLELSGPHRSTHITSNLVSHPVRSHRRPDGSESPNRRHFASFDLKMDADISYHKPTSQDFHRGFCGMFRVIDEQAKGRIASDLVVCESNRIAHRGGIVRFAPLSP